GVQLPGMLYASGLQGLQRLRLLAIIRIIWTPLYYGGGVVAMILIERNVLVLFAWQSMAFIALAVSLRVFLHKTMPPLPVGIKVPAMALPRIWQLGAGAAMLGLSASIVGQIDKIFVAALASPMQFAAYGLAFTVALQAMSAIMNAFGSAMLPHFARLLKADEGNAGDEALCLAYHRWSQIIAFVSIIGMGVLFLWSPLLIDFWIGSTSPLSSDIKRLLPVVIVAMLFGALVTAPFMLLVAANRLGPVIGVNVAGIALALIVLPFALREWGPMAGSFFSLAMMMAYGLVVVPLLHLHLLKGSLWRWLLRDFALPLCIGFTVFSVSIVLLPDVPSIARQLVHGMLTAIVAAIALAAALPDGRGQLHDSFRYFMARRQTTM
ncbi:MAG: lipopolysaccharide biosynthesis protein, partial [Beijerinckiaceae bacterium]